MVRARDSRVRISLRPFGNFCNFLYLILPVSLERDTETVGPFLSCAIINRSEVNYLTRKCLTCVMESIILPGQ